MRSLFLYATLLCATLSFTSCATILCGSKKKVTFDANIPVKEAAVTVDSRKYSHVSFPWTTKITRGFSETVVKAEAEGFEPAILIIDKKFNAAAVLNMFGLLAGVSTPPPER